MIVRKATPADADGIARVRVDTWRTAYKNIVPAAHLQNLSYKAVSRQFAAVLADSGNLVYVAEKTPGNIVGFVFGGVNKTKCLDYGGEIYAIYVLKNHEGAGIGRKLVAAVAAALSELGIGSMLIWVLSDNPYRRFYEILKGTIAGHDTYIIDGTKLHLTAYGWKDISKLG